MTCFGVFYMAPFHLAHEQDAGHIKAPIVWPALLSWNPQDIFFLTALSLHNTGSKYVLCGMVLFQKHSIFPHLLFWYSLAYLHSAPFLRRCWPYGVCCMGMPYIRFGWRDRKYCLTIINHSLLLIFACLCLYGVFVALVIPKFRLRKESY